MKALPYSLALALMTIANIADAQESAAIRMHIAATSLTEAINQWAEQTGYNVVWTEDVSASTVVPQLDGVFTPRRALEHLLKNTHLQVEFRDVHTAVISRVESRAALGKTPLIRLADLTPNLRLAALAADSATLDEVLVTAEKRQERLQDVPVPVTVLDAATLTENNQNRIQDYFATVPGLTLTTGTLSGGGTQTLAIRGVISTAASNPTVGVTIDDVPYGSSQLLGFGSVLFPDIDPASLKSIEVLRGPQGTLYGSSSIGGLIKFVTADPSTESASGRIQILGDNVQHGTSGYGLRGAVNIPVSDALAIRASAFTRRDPGYIENIATGQHDVNQVDVSGGLFSALWRPSDSVSLKINAMLQDTHANGINAIDANIDANNHLQPVFGDFKQKRLPGTESYRIKVRLYSATLTAKLPGFDFTSISSFGDNTYLDISDDSQAYGTPTSQRNNFRTKKVTQEFRLSSNSGQKLDWLAGLFYTHENSRNDQTPSVADPVTGAVLAETADFYYPTTLSEYAVFGDFTVHITDRFDVQLGGRQSLNRQVYNETDSGPAISSYYPGYTSPLVNPTEHVRGNAFTYLLTPQFKFSPNLMLYARLSSGYREGGANINAVINKLPVTYAPDKTNNYELGVKGGLLDHALSFDASAYYITWKHIQIGLFDPVSYSGFNVNGGNAKSQGLELSVQARPIKGLQIVAAASLNDAKLTQDLPANAPGAVVYSQGVAFAGDRLPYGSRLSGSLAVDQDIPLTDHLTGFVGGTLAYVGSREGEFASNPAQRLRYPAYSTMDLRMGARFGLWTVNLFGNNVFNERGIVGGGGNNAESPYFITFVQPFTIGLSVAKEFK
jgi:iron complex outermembrane receptor protein